MDIRPIRTKANYDWALADAESLFVHEFKADTKKADRFAVLSSLIAAYEAKVWPIKALDAIDAVKVVMACRHILRERLAQAFGSKWRLSGSLTHKQARIIAVGNGLHDELQIPASVLVRRYAIASRAASGRKREKVRASGTLA